MQRRSAALPANRRIRRFPLGEAPGRPCLVAPAAESKVLRMPNKLLAAAISLLALPAFAQTTTTTTTVDPPQATPPSPSTQVVVNPPAQNNPPPPPQVVVNP